MIELFAGIRNNPVGEFLNLARLTKEVSMNDSEIYEIQDTFAQHILYAPEDAFKDSKELVKIQFAFTAITMTGQDTFDVLRMALNTTEEIQAKSTMDDGTGTPIQDYIRYVNKDVLASYRCRYETRGGEFYETPLNVLEENVETIVVGTTLHAQDTNYLRRFPTTEKVLTIHCVHLIPNRLLETFWDIKDRAGFNWNGSPINEEQLQVLQNVGNSALFDHIQAVGAAKAIFLKPRLD
jgi:hypothetical protein